MRELWNWIAELSYSNIFFPYCKCVGRIRELFNWIRELSNSITERCKWISALSNCTHIESSVIELESSVIKLESSVIELESSVIELESSRFN